MTPDNDERRPPIGWFRNTAPYIKMHRGSTFVVAIPGEVSLEQRLPALAQDVALLCLLHAPFSTFYQTGNMNHTSQLRVCKQRKQAITIHVLFSVNVRVCSESHTTPCEQCSHQVQTESTGKVDSYSVQC